MNCKRELEASRDYLAGWVRKLDADSNRPNDGWPMNPCESRVLRGILKKNGLYDDAFDDVHEFDLLKCMFYPWTPNSGAAATAKTVRAQLADVESVLKMFDGGKG